MGPVAWRILSMRAIEASPAWGDGLDGDEDVFLPPYARWSLHFIRAPSACFRLPDLNGDCRMSDRTPQRITDWMSEYTSDRMPSRTSDAMSIYIYMPERMPDNISKYMSDRMPDALSEYICQKECQIKCQNIFQIECKMQCQNIYARKNARLNVKI